MEIRGVVMKVLGLDSIDDVAPKRPLFELGMDSLTTTELRNSLSEVSGTTISGTLLFDYPTIDAICAYLLDEVFDLSVDTGGDDAGGMAGGGMTNEPVAVLGMSCRMPNGGDTPELFWEALSSGEDCVSTVPLSRWDHSKIYSKDPDIPGMSITDRGGFLTFDVAEFDTKFFNISGKESERMDPAQRLLLEYTWEALEIDGIAPDSINGTRTGVFLGMCSNDYTVLEAKGGDLTPMTGHFGTGNSHAVASGRIYFTLGLKGPSFTLDTACSSALIGVHQACISLKTGETNMCVAGGEQ